jgi:PAS domain S-box-containing protein
MVSGGLLVAKETAEEMSARKRVEDELSRTTALLRAIGQISSDPIYAKGIDGRFLYANPAVLAVIGKSADVVVGHTDAEWHIDPDQAAIVMANDRRIMLTGVPEVIEETWDAVDQGPRTYRSTKAPLYLDDGSIIGIVCLSADITKLRAAEAELRQAMADKEFRLLAEALPQIVWITRADGSNIHFNQRWVEYTGLSLEESYGDGWNKPFHPDDQQRAWDAWQNAVNNNGTYSLECQLRRADGQYRWWLIRGVPLINEEGKIERWFGTCTDIHDLTWRKQVEIDLRAAKAEADRSALARSKFLAAASHDLRQPVQSLVFLLDVLKAHANTPVVANAVDAMETALDGLNSLLNGILDISRIDAGVVAAQIQSVDASGMIERLCTEYAPLCASKGLRLRHQCKTGLHARTDAALLERIIRNLVENAIRYTDHGGLLITTRRRGDMLRIDIVDSGIGIPADKLAYIFEEFYQVANTARDFKQGLGLGLSIVSRLAGLIGAEMQVLSTEGRGSCFRLQLALDPAGHDLSSPNPKAEVLAGRRIMLIEDNPEVRMGLQLLLESWNCEVIASEAGEEALEAGEREAWCVDAVISDYRLGPGMSGTAAAAEIQRRSGKMGYSAGVSLATWYCASG